MFDCILPIGETCNIGYLLHNAKIKTHTTLFEWFVSGNLRYITEILNKIANNTDDDIIKEKGVDVFIGDKIFSGHYKCEDFKIIYQRRKKRLVDMILCSKRILFCRIEGNNFNNIVYSKKDIDDFIDSVLLINKNLEDIKLMLITPNIELEHPNLIKVFYDKYCEDTQCQGKDINDLFVNSLKNIGYDIKNTTEKKFTYMSDIGV